MANLNLLNELQLSTQEISAPRFLACLWIGRQMEKRRGWRCMSTSRRWSVVRVSAIELWRERKSFWSISSLWSYDRNEKFFRRIKSDRTPNDFQLRRTIYPAMSSSIDQVFSWDIARGTMIPHSHAARGTPAFNYPLFLSFGPSAFPLGTCQPFWTPNPALLDPWSLHFGPLVLLI